MAYSTLNISTISDHSKSLTLLLVWLTMSLMSIVMIEPAPCDILMLLLVLLLPMCKLVRFNHGIILYGSLWLLIFLTNALSTYLAYKFEKSVIHVALTLYLMVASFIIAAFVCKNPVKHVHLIYSGYSVAAIIGVVAGLMGYFDIPSGAFGYFTLSLRAKGLFKDPNVLGGFLAPAIVIATYYLLNARTSRILFHGAILLLLVIGLIFTISRGAFFNTFTSLCVMIYLFFVTSDSKSDQLKLAMLLFYGSIIIIFVLVLALNLGSYSELILERASLQHYDTGHFGRVNGWIVAAATIIENPLGVGAANFAPHYYPNFPHNIYLQMHLNGGWLGGFLYLVLTFLTLAAGLLHAFKRIPTQKIFIVAYASFVGLVLEGFIVDTEHWRHYYIIKGIIWGIMSPSLFKEISAIVGEDSDNFAHRHQQI